MSLTGRQKIEAAFSPEGASEIAAVLCYEGIYIRDHWEQLTSCPWWYLQDPNLEHQMRWRRDVIAATGQDWFVLPVCYSREERENLLIRTFAGHKYLVDKRTGQRKRLNKPRIGGWTASGEPESVRPKHLTQSFDEIDALIPEPSVFCRQAFIAEGKAELATRLLREYGQELFPIHHVSSPLWSCYSLWGFEGMMTMIAERPELVEYVCQRSLKQSSHIVQRAAALGAAGIWIEDCMTDMISPAAFARLNVAFLRPLVDEIRALGMKSIYYFCGDPMGKWEQLLAVGADALSLEESKKGFSIDIEDVVERVRGRCVVLGNLDAIHLLETGSEDALRAEIARQIAAGRRNGSRFIMSIGSPVTPGTSVRRVRLYCDLVHELGR